MKLSYVLIPLALAAAFALFLAPSADALPSGEFHIGMCSCWNCASNGAGARCDAPNCGGNNIRCTSFQAHHCYEDDFFAFSLFPTPAWMLPVGVLPQAALAQ